MKKWSLITLFLTLSFAGYIFYSSGSKGSPRIEEEMLQPQYGGTLVVGIPRDVDTFNPLFSESLFSQEITHLMLLGLADLDEHSEFSPELATSWEHSPDYRSLTYHLRRDAVWSDGVPITAADVKFTFDVLMDPETGSPQRGLADFIKRVTVVDSYTVRFEFTEPYPYEIFDTAGELLPRHILENVDRKELRTHPFGRNPLSSGPFKLNKWVNQQYIELVPNEKYFGGRPYLDRVIFKIIPNPTTLLTQLQTGEIDMMIGVPPAEVKRLQANNPHLKIYPVSGRVYYYLGYNEALPQFASATVRKAITMAIDREKLVDALLYGFGKVCVGPIPPMLSWAYNDTITPFPYDLAAARKLLESEGWSDTDGDGWLDKDGKPFEFTIKTDASNQVKSDLAVIVQEQLKKIGIKVDIQLIEWTTYLKQLKERDFEAHIGGWSTSLYVDPTPVFHSSAVNLFNYGNYSNPEVDRLIELGREELNREKAARIWKQFQQVVHEDQPYTFLFWIDRIVAVHDRFENVHPIPLSTLYELEKWYDKNLAIQYAEQ